MRNNVKIAKQILADTKKKIDNWNERSQFTLKGIKNLSKSDIDTIRLYATSMIQGMGTGFNGLMDPMGDVKDVFDKYGIK